MCPNDDYLNQVWPQLSWLEHIVHSTHLPIQTSLFVLDSSPQYENSSSSCCLGRQKEANRLFNQPWGKEYQDIYCPIFKVEIGGSLEGVYPWKFIPICVN